MKPWIKNILYGIAIVAGGFILFNLAFVLAAAVSAGTSLLFGLFSDSPGVNGSTMQPFWIYIFLVLILILSWFVFRMKRLNDLLKAIYFTMPLMVVLMTIGIALYTLSQWVVAGIGLVVTAGVIFYLYKTKRPWMYYFASIYVGVLALCVMLFRIQI